MTDTRNRGRRRVLAAIACVIVAMNPLQSAHAGKRVTLVDNEKFSIMRATFDPGERQEKLHPPPGTGQIVTLVTPAEIELNLDDNGKPSTEKGHMEAGRTWWLAKTTLHQYANIGTAPFDLIVVTFKQ